MPATKVLPFGPSQVIDTLTLPVGSVPSPASKHSYVYTTDTFGGPSNAVHIVVISTLGTRDASSSDVIVTLAGLTVP